MATTKSKDNMYSLNYINIFSSSPPTVTNFGISRKVCEESCNGNAICNGYSFDPKYINVCDYTNASEPCKMVENTETQDYGAIGNCYILGTGPTVNNIPVKPVYIKNNCNGYDEICSTIWYNQLVIFLVILSLLLLLNMALYNKYREVKRTIYTRF